MCRLFFPDQSILGPLTDVFRRAVIPTEAGIQKRNEEVNHRDPILVLVEAEGGRCAPITFELLKAGSELSQEKGDTLCVCILGHDVSGLAEEIAWYASRVYVVDDRSLSRFQPDLHAAALYHLCLYLKPRCLVMGHTYENLEMAPKLSGRLGTDLVTDCIRVERDQGTGHLLCTKPVYGGHAQAVFELDTFPQMVLIRPKGYKPSAKDHSKGEIIPLDCRVDVSPTLSESIASVPGERINLDQAEAIVSAGRGVRNAEGIGEIKKLIGTLEKYFDRVELGASRPLVESGLLPRSRQVGQTGERVAPRLYIAVGISGSIQHLTGMVGSGKIVAVNRDRDAPIFGAADYGVVGPFEEVLPALIEGLEELS